MKVKDRRCRRSVARSETDPCLIAEQQHVSHVDAAQLCSGSARPGLWGERSCRFQEGGTGAEEKTAAGQGLHKRVRLQPKVAVLRPLVMLTGLLTEEREEWQIEP